MKNPPTTRCLLVLLILTAVLVPASKVSASTVHAEKKPLSIEDLDSWKRITEKVISPDGRWIAYKVEPWQGNSTIYLYGSDGKKAFEFERGKNLRISADSKHLFFTVSPKPGQSGQRERFAVYSLDSGKLDSIESLKTYKTPSAWSGWLAYQVEVPAKESRPNGFTLNLRDLDSGKTVSWPFVTEYHFAARGKRLFFVSTGDKKKNFQPGLYVYDLDRRRIRPILSGKNRYAQIMSSGSGDRLAFLAGPNEASENRNENRKSKSEKNISLYFWDGRDTAKVIVENGSRGIPENWRISEHGQIAFSRDGRRVFFGIAPPRMERDPSIPADEFPDLDVWHGSEPLLQSVQLVQRDRELKRTYRAMYDRKGGKLLQLETEAIPQSLLLDGGNADHAVLYSGKPYELQSMWDPIRHDVYLLDLTTGEKRLVVKGVRDRAKPSPQGKFLVWFDYADDSYYTYHVAEHKTYRVTRPSVLRADEEKNTTFDENAPYGSPGWLEDDRALLVYDRYDIWKVDPLDRNPPENLTQNGRKTRTVYRLLALDRRPGVVDQTKTQYLLGTNEVSRKTGYYRCPLADGPARRSGSSQDPLSESTTPTLLLGGKYLLSSPIKADRAETVVYAKETFGQFPDLWVSNLDFRKSVRISDANPQQADFRWGTAELYRWTSLDGRPLEGILYKPENFDPAKKYPMIVQFFHKSSDQLFHHRTPEFHRSRIDYHFFVSNGYVVFNPDIYFDPGYIGESAYKSILPGVTTLIDDGFIDPKRIGAQGHSYSGYQAAYLATRTNLFACIEAGAPVVNFFSAYGGIRTETGRSRAAQYEHDQTLATPWEAPLRFLENSPLFAMDKVTTPILIVHNDHDGAVPWSQGIEYFLALRRLQKPVWMLNYNGEGHTVSKMKNRKDLQIRLKHFFDHYLKDTPMPDWMRQGVPAVDKGRKLGYEPSCRAENTRPIRNRAGYCWDGREMDRFVDSLEKRASKQADDLPPLVAGISPHADYRVAGHVYYPLFQKIAAPEVVIFGVTHRKTREELGVPQDKLIFDSHTAWQGPYGKIPVSPLREYLEKRLDPQCYIVSDEAHRLDHSIEGTLPFLQHARKDVQITPILITAMSFDTMETVSAKLADALAAYMKEKRLTPGRDIFFLISADANHYGKDFNNYRFGEGEAAHQKATAHDRQLVESYLQGTISTAKLKNLTEQLWGKNFKDYGPVVWCGQYSIPFGLLTVQHLTKNLSPNHRLTGHPFLYSDSYTDTRPPLKNTGLKPDPSNSLDHWFGYFSAGFY